MRGRGKQGSFLDRYADLLVSRYHIKYIFCVEKRRMKPQHIFVLSLFLAASLALPVMAAEGTDDVLTTIDQAVKQYRVGDYAGAASNLDYASQLVRQKKSERMKELLPEPLAGWQAKPASAQTLGTAVFGGGVTVSRDYAKAGATVSMEIVSDSPVLQSVMMMLNNPMFAGAAGGSLITVKGQRAILKYDDKAKNGELNIVVANRFMVTVKGNKVEKQTLVDYAGAIDFVQLAKN